MKSSIAILCLVIFRSLFAHALPFKSADLKGTWKETARFQSGKKVTYKDTLFFEFLEDNICIWGRPKSLSLRAPYVQIGTTLEIGPSDYEVLKQTEDYLSLSTEDGLEMVFTRYQKGVEPTDNTATTSSKRGAQDKGAWVPNNIEQLVGVWKCYKRSSDKPIQSETKYRMLRLVEIVEKGEEITGKMYGYKDMDNQPSWIVQKYEKGILYCAGKDDRLFKVIHCQQGHELVIENEGIVYYMNIQ
jgi:hypothetical protein